MALLITFAHTMQPSQFRPTTAMRLKANACVLRMLVLGVVGIYQVSTIYFVCYSKEQRTPSLDVGGLPSCMNEPSDNIIGWELLVSGLPIEATETDIMVNFNSINSRFSVYSPILEAF